MAASIFYAGVRFGFSCLPHFGWGQNAANTLASSTSQKFSKQFLLFYISGGEKFIKGVFARFRPPHPPVVIRRRKSGGWEAESFLVAQPGWEYPTHPKQSLSPSGRFRTTRGSSAFGVFACLHSKPAFPLKEKKPCIKYSSTLLSFFQKTRTVRNAKRHFAFQAKRLLPFGFALLDEY